MQKSATGIYKTKSGFTLIEVLIVLVIIAIVVGAASILLSGRGNAQAWRSDANILLSQIQLAQQQAILSNQTYGLAISNTEYKFTLYTKDKNTVVWNPVTQQAGLLGKIWPETNKIILKMNDVPVSLPVNQLPPSPQIIFYPSGQVSSFELRINDQYLIKTNVNGGISLDTIDEN